MDILSKYLSVYVYIIIVTSKLTLLIDPVPGQSWKTVYDVGQTINQHWIHVVTCMWGLLLKTHI